MFINVLSLVLSNVYYLALHIMNNGSFPKPLNKEEERDCLIKLKEGDMQAKNKLIEHNLRLVAHIIKKYYSKTNEQDDLISIGTIGLIKAVSSFDFEKGARFATYASKCIENEILMHFRNQKKTAQDVYFGDPIDMDKDGNTITLMDIVSDDACVSESMDIKLEVEKLNNLLKTVLDERERFILTLRYGITGKMPLTQREVASMLKISRSYVSRIEKKAILTLRKYFYT